MRSRWLTLLCMLTVVPVAHADPLRKPALHWVRLSEAETCIDPRSLAERVEALTGPVFVIPAEADVSVEGEIGPLAPEGFRVRVTVTDRKGSVRGERVIEQRVSDCRALDASIAFVIAVTIDPSIGFDAMPDGLSGLLAEETPPEETLLAELEQTPPRPVAVPATTTETKAQPEPEAVKPARAPDAQWEAAAMLAGISQVGVPFAGGVALSLRRSVLRFVSAEISAHAFTPVRERNLGAGTSVSVQAYDAGASLCAGRERPRATALRLCVGPALTWWRAVGNGFDRQNDASMLRVALVVQPELRVHIAGAFSVRLDGIARVNLSRGGFSYTTALLGDRVAFTIPRLQVGVSVGPAFEF